MKVIQEVDNYTVKIYVCLYSYIYSIFKIYLYSMYISCTYGLLGREKKASETITTLRCRGLVDKACYIAERVHSKKRGTSALVEICHRLFPTAFFVLSLSNNFK